jgi:hypothetical protein
LGKGHYGKVYLAYELAKNTSKVEGKSFSLNKKRPLVCKVIDRSKLSSNGEKLIKNEI